MHNISFAGVFVTALAITLFLFQFLDQLAMEVKQHSRLLRPAIAIANGVLAVCCITLYHNRTPAAFLVLLLDICIALEYAAMSRDRLSAYVFFGSAVFFNHLMVYVLMYAVFRFLPVDGISFGLYQSEVFIAASTICIGILLLYRLPIFPTGELKRIIHSREHILLNIWFPIVSSITFLNTVIILPVMEGAWLSQNEWLNHGREIAFYTIIAEWTLILMSSSYLVVFYQTGRIRAQDKFLNVKEQADCHPLTGMLNRRAWERRVTKVLASGERGYLVMLDLDNFKEVNDNLGHLEGDRVLRETADMLRQTFRVSDIIGHIGGDEFCVFLPGNFEKDAVDQRLELLMSLCRKGFRSKTGKLVWLSLSAGYAAVPEQGAKLEDLIAKADTALYWQKENGRNGFAMFRDEMAS